MTYGFIKACTVSPALRVADCPYNTQMTIEAMQKAASDGVQLAVFPELGLTGYTCGDLFLQQPLQKAAEAGLAAILKASEGLDLVALVGLPVLMEGKLYNCAAVVCHGRLLGLVPKTHLPNYSEFYEKRHYNPAPAGLRAIRFAGQDVPFGTALLYQCEEMPEFCLGVEVCEDLWAPLPPSTRHALAGATVIANLSASDETVGKAVYRRQLVSQRPPASNAHRPDHTIRFYFSDLPCLPVFYRQCSFRNCRDLLLICDFHPVCPGRLQGKLHLHHHGDRLRHQLQHLHFRSFSLQQMGKFNARQTAAQNHNLSMGYFLCLIESLPHAAYCRI